MVVQFRELISFFAVPLGLLVVSWLLQRNFRMRLNAGTEFFTFLLALDMTYIIWFDTGTLRINPRFAEIYLPFFVALSISSLILMIYATRIQSLIYAHTKRHLRYYPLWRVTICWLFGLAGIGFHLYALLGGPG